jgi:hypothetical protein
VANQSHTQRAREWASLSGKLEELNLYLNQAPAQEVDRVEREIAALQDELLDIPAPSLTAVQQKLEMLWDAELHGLDQNSEERRMILEDLEGLIMAQRQLIGA